MRRPWLPCRRQRPWRWWLARPERADRATDSDRDYVATRVLQPRLSNGDFCSGCATKRGTERHHL